MEKCIDFQGFIFSNSITNANTNMDTIFVFDAAAVFLSLYSSFSCQMEDQIHFLNMSEVQKEDKREAVLTIYNSDRKDPRESKNYIRYATRQKRSESKRALRNLLFSINSDYTSFENKCRLDEEDEADDSDIGRNKEQSKRQIRSHYKKMKRKLKKENSGACFEEDFGRTFQAKFGNRWYTWSFGKQQEESHFQDSTTGFEWRDFSNRTYSRNNKWANESDVESDNESSSYAVGSSSDRTLLGLPANGPLKTEDVKNAFRLSALKWHPDKHQGSGQAVAEEKFKCCATAYKSLCSALSSS